MDTETFWRLIESARGTVGSTYTADYDDRLTAALKALLVQLPADEIMDFDRRLGEVGAAAYSTDMEAAAHLVSHVFFDGWHGPRYYCFVNGLILLGREPFERAVRSPDTLAGNPAIQAVALRNLPRTAFVAQGIYEVASAAYAEVESVTVDEYLGRLWGEDDDPEDEDEDEDTEDDAEEQESSYYDDRGDWRWEQGLPQLLALFGPPRVVRRTSQTGKAIKSDEMNEARPVLSDSHRNEPPAETDDVFDAVLGQEDRGGRRWWQRWLRP